MFFCVGCVCFFFKQKTAYEVRISDWSSDVCSSDLDHRRLSERMHREQFGRCEIGFRIAVVEFDLIRRADFLEQPQYALRTAVVEVMDDQAHIALPGSRRSDANVGRPCAKGKRFGESPPPTEIGRATLYTHDTHAHTVGSM